MTFFVSFRTWGRFGNNLIQYIACRLLGKLTGVHRFTRPDDQNSHALIVKDEEWVWAMTCGAPDEWKHRDLYLDGFFQRGDLWLPHTDFILSLMNEHNTDVVSDHMSVASLIQPGNVDAQGVDTVAVHLRLGDFNHDGTNANIVDVQFFVDEVIKSRRRTVLIVVDAIRSLIDLQYIMTLCTRITPHVSSIRFQTGPLLEDWNTLRNASYLISSNSSFAWVAAFFNPQGIVVYPDTHFYPEQTFSIDKPGWRCERVQTVDLRTLTAR